MNIIDLLELIKNKIEGLDSLDVTYLVSNGNDNGFEKLFPILMEEVKNEVLSTTTLEYEVHLGHHFPDVDIILDKIKYGIELKSRKDGSWSTNGNSVFESITGKNYEDIYIIFASRGRNESNFKIKYAPYWQVTSGIKVTHSPRFTINMNNLNNSVFESKAQYDLLRTKDEKEKVDFLQDYLKYNSDGSKWYTAPSEYITATKFSKLSQEKKDRLIVELFILFPDDLLMGSPNDKYDRANEYLLDTYYVYNSSLRDTFTSGGKIHIDGVEFPKVISNLQKYAPFIIDVFRENSEEFSSLVIENWKMNLPDKLITGNLLESYKNILNYIGTSKTKPNDDDSYYNLLLQINTEKLSKLIW